MAPGAEGCVTGVTPRVLSLPASGSERSRGQVLSTSRPRFPLTVMKAGTGSPAPEGHAPGAGAGRATSGGGVTTSPPTHTGAPGRTPGERAERPVTGSSGSLETSRRGWTEAWAPPHPRPCLVCIAGAMPASGPGPASRPRLPPPCQAHGVLPFHVTEAGGQRTGRAETACPTSVPWGPDERHPRVARWPSPGLREEGRLLRQTSLP